MDDKELERLNKEILAQNPPQNTFNTDDLSKGGEHVEFSDESQ